MHGGKNSKTWKLIIFFITLLAGVPGVDREWNFLKILRLSPTARPRSPRGCTLADTRFAAFGLETNAQRRHGPLWNWKSEWSSSLADPSCCRPTPSSSLTGLSCHWLAPCRHWMAPSPSLAVSSWYHDCRRIFILLAKSSQLTETTFECSLTGGLDLWRRPFFSALELHRRQARSSTMKSLDQLNIFDSW